MTNRRKRITPSQAEEAAKKKEKENMRFRSFLPLFEGYRDEINEEADTEEFPF